MCFWSHSQLFSGKFYYTKVVVNLVRSRPPIPTPDSEPGPGGPKQGLECIYSLNRANRQKLYATKFVGQSCFGGGRSCVWAHNQDLEGPGPVVRLEPWSIIFWLNLLNKSCSESSQ
jgi:hypothetical protein